MTPLSNFDLIDAAKKLAIKNFRGVFMKDQLPKQPKRVETGIINLDNSSGEGTHWVAYAIDPRGIVYFDSYGLAPPKEFMRYIKTILPTIGFCIIIINGVRAKRSIKSTVF